MIRIGIAGCQGRMGQQLCQLILKQEDLILEGGTERPDHPDINKPISSHSPALIHETLTPLLDRCDVIIDFTSAMQSLSHLEEAAKRKAKGTFVIGSTGFTRTEEETLKNYAKTRPILHETNMSLGIAVLRQLVTLTAQKLEDFDAEILEMHHRYKKDSPSGTAMTLGKTIANARGLPLDDIARFERHGHTPREENELGIMAFRGVAPLSENIPVFFSGLGESIELTHRANDRQIFAHGALVAARWIATQPPGLYGIDHVLETPFPSLGVFYVFFPSAYLYYSCCRCR